MEEYDQGGSSWKPSRTSVCRQPHCPDQGLPGDMGHLLFRWLERQGLKKTHSHGLCRSLPPKNPLLRAKGDRDGAITPARSEVLDVFESHPRGVGRGHQPHGWAWTRIDGPPERAPWRALMRRHSPGTGGLCPLQTAKAQVDEEVGARLPEGNRRVIPTIPLDRLPRGWRNGDNHGTSDPRSLGWRWCPVSADAANWPRTLIPQVPTALRAAIDLLIHQRTHMPP